MLSDPVIIFIILPAVLIYIVLISIFFRNNRFKDLFMRSYLMTGLMIGVVYIIINITIPHISSPLKDYMILTDYSENPIKIANDVKTIVNDPKTTNDLITIINSSERAVDRLEQIEEVLGTDLKNTIENFEFHNKKKSFIIIQDIVTYNGINKIGQLIKTADDPERLLKDMINKRQKENIVRGIGERTSEINSNVSTMSMYSKNQIENISDLKIASMFEVEDSTMFKIYADAVNDMIDELERIDREINVDSIIVDNDIRIAKNLNKISANIGRLEWVNNELSKLLDGIRDRITSYNNQKEKLGNPDINIDAGYLIGEHIRNLKAINTISWRLLQIRDIIAGSYLLKTFQQVDVTNMEEVVTLIEKAITYNKTDSLLTFLYHYSDDPIHSLQYIERLHQDKNKEVLNKIRSNQRDYLSIERNLSEEPNYDMGEPIYKILSDELLEEINDSCINTLEKLKTMLEEDKDYQLFNEATIVIDEEDKKALIKNSQQILSDVVLENLPYRPEYMLIPAGDLNKINDIFQKHLIENITELIIKKKRNFPRRRIVFLSNEFKNNIYKLAINSIEEQITQLEEIELGIPNSIIDEDYKEMLDDNNELKIPATLKTSIIKYVNPILDRKLTNVLKDIEKDLSNFISYDKMEKAMAMDVLNHLESIIKDKSITNVADRIISMGEDHELIQSQVMPISTKMENLGKNDNLIQNKVISSYQTFSLSMFNTVVGFIISVLLWPLIGMIFLSGGYLASHSSFLFYNTGFMVILIIVGFIALVLPFLIGLISSWKSSQNKE